MGLFDKLIQGFRGKKSKHNHKEYKSEKRLLLDHKENWKKCKSCKHFDSAIKCSSPLNKACEKYEHK